MITEVIKQNPEVGVYGVYTCIPHPNTPLHTTLGRLLVTRFFLDGQTAVLLQFNDYAPIFVDAVICAYSYTRWK